MIEYVLQRAAPADEEAIVSAIRSSLDALDTFVSDGSERAMHALHSAAGTPAQGD